MMRHLKVARRTAVKARTSAMITLKQIVVTAPPALREPLHPLADQALLTLPRNAAAATGARVSTRASERHPGPMGTADDRARLDTDLWCLKGAEGPCRATALAPCPAAHRR